MTPNTHTMAMSASTVSHTAKATTLTGRLGARQRRLARGGPGGGVRLPLPAARASRVAARLARCSADRLRFALVLLVIAEQWFI